MPLLGARTIIRISSSGEDELTMRIWGATKGRGTPRLWGHDRSEQLQGWGKCKEVGVNLVNPPQRNKVRVAIYEKV